ncbi:MAG: hypothetical protein AAB215_00855 [Planctomycetota bacterium]
MTAWDLKAPAKGCAKCGRPFPGGATIVSGLRLVPEGCIREDFCEPCFTEGEGHATRWHTRIPMPPPKKPRLDPNAVHEFFRNLEGDGDREQAFRYVLALYLVRKRILRLEGARRRILSLSEAKGEGRYRIPEVELTAERVSEIFDWLQQVLIAPAASA